jgi:hypothetical protein
MGLGCIRIGLLVALAEGQVAEGCWARVVGRVGGGSGGLCRARRQGRATLKGDLGGIGVGVVERVGTLQCGRLRRWRGRRGLHGLGCASCATSRDNAAIRGCYALRGDVLRSCYCIMLMASTRARARTRIESEWKHEDADERELRFTGVIRSSLAADHHPLLG